MGNNDRINSSHELVGLVEQHIKTYQKMKQDDALTTGRQYQWVSVGTPAVVAFTWVLGQHLKGDTRARVKPEPGRIDMREANFLNGLIVDDPQGHFDPKNWLRATVSLPEDERKDFLAQVKAIANMSSTQRAALVTACKTLIPRADGFRVLDKLIEALESDHAHQYISFE